MPRFGKASEENLKGVDDRLVSIYRKAIEIFDCTILDGIRTVAEQTKNVAKGVSKTMNSKHIPVNGVGKAVDAMPYPVNWDAIQKGFNALNKLPDNIKYEILRAYYFQGLVAGIAHEKGIKIRQGIDWNSNDYFNDQSFHDVPHAELVD